MIHFDPTSLLPLTTNVSSFAKLNHARMIGRWQGSGGSADKCKSAYLIFYDRVVREDREIKVVLVESHLPSAFLSFLLSFSATSHSLPYVC